MLAASVTVVTTGVVHAFNPQPEPPAFGMASLARTQTALLNAVLTQPPDPQQPPDPGLACRLVLSFVDANGVVFHDAAGNLIQRPVELRDHVAASLQLRAADILGPTQLRVPIRAVLTYQPPDPTQPSDCTGLVGTLEIVNLLGSTQLLVTGTHPPQATAEPQ
jgi:hypothetical protein